MDKLQQALNGALLDAPYQALADTIAKKFAAQGVKLTTREREQVVEHLKSETEEEFRFRRWQWWLHRQVDINVADEESVAILERFTDFIDKQLPTLLQQTVETSAATVLKSLQRKWATESRRENRVRHQFERRVHRHWGRGIDRLRLLLWVAREFGEDTANTLRSDPDSDTAHLLDALSRLHARACQVADEVICLLSAGFADGAMARWRTLHEIAVVAFFLKEHGEDSARRYIDHQVVESFRAASDYHACSECLGYEPLPESEFDEVRQAFDEVVLKYGKPFQTQYGWAASALKMTRPRLQDIEQSAGIDHLRAHYRMASHNVHANPKGVFFKLGLIGETDMLLAGPSNAGLADPGSSAAISLTQVSVALGTLRPNLDSLVVLRVLAGLRDEIDDALIESHRLLEGNGG